MWIVRLHYFALLTVFTPSNKVQASMIVFYGPCNAGVFDVLHEVHDTVLKYSSLPALKNQDQALHANRPKIQYLRQYQNDTCNWISDDTMAILVVSETNTTGQEVVQSAAHFNIPYLITQASDVCACGEGTMLSLVTPALSSNYVEEAAFDYLEQEHLNDVLIVHAEGSTAGLHLSFILNSASIRVTHVELAEHFDALQIVETFFNTWNETSLSRARRRLVTFDRGPSIDAFFKTLMKTIMQTIHARFLVVDSPAKWMKRISKVKSYEADIVVISDERVVFNQCPVALEVLPHKLYSERSTKECSSLSFRKKSEGESLLLNIKDDLDHCCTRPKYEQYTIWKSFSATAKSRNQSLKPIGIWSPPLRFLGTEIIEFASVELRIIVLKYSPYIVLNKTGEGEITLGECVLLQILEHLVEKLNIKYELITPHDQEFGLRKADGSWTGAVGMVLEGEADMIPFLTVTSGRTLVIDFSIPVANTEYGMLVASPSEPPRTFIFLRPFTKEVWIITVMTSMVISIVLNLIHVLNQKFSDQYKGKTGLAKYTNCLWCIFCPMVQQSGIHMPESVSGRLVLSTWCLALLVIVSTYSAKLIAFLAFPEAQWILETIQDLADHKSILLMMDEGCAVLEDFNHSEIEVYRKIRKVYLENPKRGFILRMDDVDIAELVSTGHVVYIDDLNFLTKLIGEDYEKTGKCRVTIAPEKFFRMTNAIGFRRGSSIRPAINKEIKQLGESGVLGHWRAKYRAQRDECFDMKTTIRGSYEEVGYNDVEGAFHLFVLGVGLSVGMLAFEIVRQRLNYFKRHYYKTLN